MSRETSKETREKRVFSLDVECVATGRGHNDRAPCRIGLVELVNGSIEVVLDRVTSCPNILDPLTAVTGLTIEEIQRGEPLDDVLKELRRKLGAGSILIGQCVSIDVEWCALTKGVDFAKTVELDQELVFTMESKDARKRTWIDQKFSSLRAKAFALLGKALHDEGQAHSPVDDAIVSLEIYRDWVQSGRIHEAREKLKDLWVKNELPRKIHVSIVGICSAKFNKSRCTCNQPVVERKPGKVIGAANEPCFEFMNNNGYCYKGEACRYRHSFGDLILKTKPCFKFREGWCRRGAKCSFLHDYGSDDKSSSSMDRPPSPRMMENTTAENETFRKEDTCFAWQNRGYCAKGDACRWLHPTRQPEPPAPVSSGWVPPHSFSNQMPIQKSAPTPFSFRTGGYGSRDSPAPPQPAQRPCSYFVKLGRCKWGNACYFAHDDLLSRSTLV